MPTVTVRKLADISAVIKAVREDQGLSQASLAEQLVFSRDYMVDLESAKPSLYTTRLFRVLHRLGITLTLEYNDNSICNDHEAHDESDAHEQSSTRGGGDRHKGSHAEP